MFPAGYAPRAQGRDLNLIEGGKYQSHYEYGTGMPLKDIINETFFVTCHERLKAGDQIALVRYRGTPGAGQDERVLELATVRVVECSREAVELFLVGDIIVVPQSKHQPEQKPQEPDEIYVQGKAKAKWNPGKQSFDVVMVETAALVARFPKEQKDLAYAVAAGSEPIPQEPTTKAA